MNINIETKYKQNQQFCCNKTFQEIKVNIEYRDISMFQNKSKIVILFYSTQPLVK